MLVELIRPGAGLPVPVARDRVRPLPHRLGPRVEPHEGEARRGHQALLTTRDHHVDAPVVHVERVAGEAGDAIGHQQRRVPSLVKHSAQPLDIVLHGGRRIHLHRKDRGDLVLGVGLQDLGHLRQIDRRAPPEIEQLRLGAHLRGHLPPGRAEMAGAQHQHPVAAADHVAQRGLPAGMAVADVDRHLPGGTRDGLEVGDDAAGHVDDLAGIDVRRRAVHGLQHPVGNDRGAGDGEILATVVE